MDTTLDPKVFPTIKDKPRHQQYHIESENIEALAQKINGTLKKFYTVIKSNNASFTNPNYSPVVAVSPAPHNSATPNTWFS